jgi:hypothetical protein
MAGLPDCGPRASATGSGATRCCGSTWAFGGEGGTQKGIFLQGATLDWKPTSNSLVRFEYRDVRSPLQYGYGGYGYGSPYGYGYGSPSSLGGLGGPDDVPVGSGLPGDPMRN